MESDGIENSQSASIYSCVVGIYSNFIFMRERREREKERERKRERERESCVSMLPSPHTRKFSHC